MKIILHLFISLGMVVFLSGVQVYGTRTSFDMNGFNFAAGTGLRILFNKDSRSNFRIDYAWGLSADSNGIGKRQIGFYLYVAKAF